MALPIVLPRLPGDRYPDNHFKLTLHFRTKEDMEYFKGQLSDGWGENEVGLRCDWTAEEGPDPFERRTDLAVDYMYDEDGKVL